MYKIDSLNSVDGHFSNGDYRTGHKGTLVPALWLNALQSEICNYITNSGIALDKNDNSQMLSALNKNLEKDLQKQTISGNAQSIYYAGTILAEFDVPPGGLIDLTVLIRVATLTGISEIVVIVLNAATSFDYKSVFFDFFGDVSRIERRRICLKNDTDDLKSYKVKVSCSGSSTIIGNVDLNGWADYDAEVNNAQD